MQPYDFIAIGDVVTDAFIHLKDARVQCNANGENCELCVRFGDKVPYESVTVIPAVGNAANAAVAAARLGLKTAFVSDIGDDLVGTKNLEVFKKESVATDFITVHQGKESNYHYVLWYKADRTILVKHQEYTRTLPDLREKKWVYLSSLGGDSLSFHMEVANYLEQHKQAQLAFQPGTFQMQLGSEKLERIYRHTSVFFCNKEEAQRILDSDMSDIAALLKKLRDLGPKTVVITDGPRGTYAYNGKEIWFVPMYPDPKPPLDRTGAGDAFASTVTVALALGKTLPEALAWGPINAMSVVQYIGAREGLLSREMIESYLKNPPSLYRVEKIQ